MFSGGKVYYDMTLTDVKTGKVVKKYRKRVCHSFVRQFAEILRCAMNGDVTTICSDTGGTVRTIILTNQTNTIFKATSAAGDATMGSIVGTGTTAVTINDYKIETLIAHGTGAGQLQYSAETFGAPTSDATSNYVVLTRIFTNGSGNPITVKEIALYASCKDVAGSTEYPFCILHDILASSVAVANGLALTLNYTVKVTL